VRWVTGLRFGGRRRLARRGEGASALDGPRAGNPLSESFSHSRPDPPENAPGTSSQRHGQAPVTGPIAPSVEETPPKVARDPARRRSCAISLGILVALAAVVVALYYPMTRAWFFADDFAWLVDSAAFCRHPISIFGRDFGGFIRPLLHATFAADYCLFGEHAAAYYWTNIAIHALNTVLVFVLLQSFGGPRPMAALAALLFGVGAPHWVATALIAARPEGLVTAFVLGTMIAFQRWKTSGSNAWYGAMIALFVLAMSSKETAVVVPPLMVVSEWLFHRRVTLRGQEPIWFMAGLGGLAMFFNSRIATQWSESFDIGVHMAPQVESGLVQIWAPVQVGEWYRWLWLAPAAALAAAGAAGNRYQRLGAVWMVLTLVPYTLSHKYVTIAPRYMYLASIGAQLLVASSVWAAWEWARAAQSRVALAVGLISLLSFHIMSARASMAERRDLTHRLRIASRIKPRLTSERRAVVLVNLRFGWWYLYYLYGYVPPYIIVDIGGHPPAIIACRSLRGMLRQLEAENPPGTVTLVQSEPTGQPGE
jgi:hypothetical protein